ncbi:MAG TPA: monofunctional biosynthetic peptidoglycan transglycosylase [Acetobacteraceae bacterium]|nr:monofunctional biosynthetic peptidoglycan transglycosylase [Acetobacteraceae bacterium]
MPGRRSAAPGARSIRLWRLARRLLLVLLLGPPLLILLFRFVPVPLTPLMVIRLVQGYGLHHQWVGYERIAPDLPRSLIASEDNLFCQEKLGFDTAALETQIGVWWHGGRPRGASTITMQVARNLFLWQGRDWARKLLEAWLTPQVALLWPKQRILEVYLNSVEFGPGLFGVQAAARQDFRRSAAQLDETQAARLIAVLPAPLEWSPAHPNRLVLWRADIIRHRIGQLGPLLDCARR